MCYAEDAKWDAGIRVDEENKEVRTFVGGVAEALATFNTSEAFKPTAILTTCDGKRKHFELKFLDSANRKCFCVQFERGIPNDCARWPESEAPSRVLAHFKRRG